MSFFNDDPQLKRWSFYNRMNTFHFFEYYIGIFRVGSRTDLYAVFGKGKVTDGWTVNEWMTAEEIGQLLGGN